MAIIKNPLTLVKQESGGQTTGEYYACVIDYDGTIIKEERLNNGQKFKMPTPPTHEGLVFDGWSSTQEIVNSEITINDNNFMAGPMYYTSSGYNEFDIELNIATGLTFSINVNNTDSPIIIWGDGTSETVTTTGTLTHTYSSYGIYTIKYNGVFSDRPFYKYPGFDSSKMVIAARLSKNYDFLVSAGNIFASTYIRYITIPDNNSNRNIIFGSYTFSKCAFLKSLIIPTNTFSAFNVADLLSSSNYLQYIVLPYTLENTGSITLLFNYNSAMNLRKIVLPRLINKTYTFSLPGNYLCEEIIVPSSCTQATFNNASALTKVKIETTNFSFQICRILSEITIPSITSLSNNAFNNCNSINPNDVLQDTITSIGNSALANGDSQYRYQRKTIIMPKQLAYIGSSAFYNNNNTLIFDFTRCEQIPALSNTNAFSGTSGSILVPSTLYAQWITETNWSSLASRIVSVQVS